MIIWENLDLLHLFIYRFILLYHLVFRVRPPLYTAYSAGGAAGFVFCEPFALSGLGCASPFSRFDGETWASVDLSFLMIKKAPAAITPRSTKPKSIGSKIIGTMHQVSEQKPDALVVIETITQHANIVKHNTIFMIFMQEIGVKEDLYVYVH